MSKQHSALLPHEAERNPIVFVKDGGVFATSRDVAEFFGKEHRHVLRDIDNLIAAEPDLALSNFGQGSYVLPATGAQAHRQFEMDRDGFTLLAMGFTGQKALKWKLRYIEAFNSMEAELRRQSTDVSEILADPTALRRLLSDYTDKVITLEGKVEEMRPQVQALERIAISDGSFCVTDAAKTLQVQPKALFSFLRSHRWVYARTGVAGDIAYQDKLAAGLLEHKVTTVYRTDGTEKTVTQVRVTPKGLAALARVFPPVGMLV